ncbi:Sua5 family C-terminal domain-containing protein [Streptomyces sp. NPDC055056]
MALPASMAAYARELYGFLRELDQQGCNLAVASLPMEEGPWAGDRVRLGRAAGPRNTVCTQGTADAGSRR